MHDAWTTRRDELESGAGRLTEALQAADSLDLPAAPVTDDDLRRASQALAGSEDRTHGGWGDAPKFPQSMAIEFLLRRHLATGEGLLLDIADRALHRMARGGIYDHVGGGFHRYSVDAAWHVPHFEKMLYDNSQLARVYLHAWQIGGGSGPSPGRRRNAGLGAAGNDASSGRLLTARWTPTPKAKRASSTSGRWTRCARSWARTQIWWPTLTTYPLAATGKA